MIIMKQYDLIIITTVPFPYGISTTNRISNYASAIARYKRVAVLTLAGPYTIKYDLASKGVYNNVDYSFFCKTYEDKRPSRMVRVIKRLVRYLKMICALLFQYQTKSVVVITRSYPLELIVNIISYFKHFNLFREISETQEYISKPLLRSILTKSMKIYDGIIIISNGMRDYYSFIKDDSKFFLLPILVNIDSFVTANAVVDKYFFYCSGANLERDGFLDGLNAFLKFNKSNPEYKLYVASKINFSDPYHREAYDLMTKNSNCVIYLGQLPSSSLPQLLMSATALLITPHAKYITRGFPTKLGEYLASARPVICTSIDDLHDNLDINVVYMIEPNSPDLICSAMQSIVDDPNHANEVGHLGREYAKRMYNPQSYTDSLISFLKL